jgi:flagellar basal-body rod protein FlgB
VNGLWTDKATLSLQKGLDASAQRHRAGTNNVANVNTPGYKRKEVAFEEQLRQALTAPTRTPMVTTHPRHMGGGTSFNDVVHTVRKDSHSTMRADGNNVDIDREMAMMAANQLNYNALSQVLNERYSLVRYVIHEGRR